MFDFAQIEYLNHIPLMISIYIDQFVVAQEAYELECERVSTRIAYASVLDELMDYLENKYSDKIYEDYKMEMYEDHIRSNGINPIEDGNLAISRIRYHFELNNFVVDDFELNDFVVDDY